MIRITMMELRSEPGEWIYHQVFKHGERIVITHCGKEIAQICPLEITTIKSNGKIHGKMPLTHNCPKLING